MKILVLGASGMLGHIIYDYYKEEEKNVVVGTGRKGKFDYVYDAYLNMCQIEDILEKEKPNVVINCIGILNKEAEDNHVLAVALNTLFPHYIDSLSSKYKFKFIHISTDCIFSGTRGNYSENDLSDATSFYGRSKALGEINNDKSLTIRTSIVGPDIDVNGIGLFNWFMKQTDSVGGYTHAVWTGVTTLQLAKVIIYAINNNMTGVHNAVNNTTISKYELLELFKKYMFKKIIINKNENFYENKSLVNYNNEFKNIIPSYEKMVADMCEWIKNHKELYKY